MAQTCRTPTPTYPRTRCASKTMPGLCAVLLAALLLSVPPAQATSVQAMSLAELVEAAQLVVVGKAVRTESRWAEGGKAIVTDVEVQVEATVVGTAKQGGSVVLTHLGGRLGDVALSVPGAPKLKAGQRALFFLVDNGRGGLRFVGFHQGLMEIYRDGESERVQTGVADAHQMTRDSSGKLVNAPPAVTDGTSLPDLITRIRALAGK